MIKLSDYLDYLNKEIIQSRKKADENTIRVAKEYAQDEYLKYFKAPRYAFTSIKLDIPLKITDISAEKKFNFKLDEAKFLSEVNAEIEVLNREKKLSLPLLSKEQIEKKEFRQLFTTLEAKDQRFVQSIEEEVKKIDLKPQLDFLKIGKPVKPVKPGSFTPQESSAGTELNEMKRVITDVIAKNHTIVGTKLNDLYIDPNTTGAADKEKIFVNLHVEMEEEGIRIATFNDKDGKTIEEIIFE